MILALLFACKLDQQGQITETGNPERNLAIAVFDPAVKPQVDSAWASLGETEFELEAQYEGEHELEWRVPGVVADLAAGPVSLPFVSPSLGYDKIEIRPKRSQRAPAGAPDDLAAASFVIDGVRADGVAFRIVSKTEEETELPGGFALTDDQMALALGLDVDALLDGVGIDGVSPGDDGAIRVSADENPAVLEAVDKNLSHAFRLVIDLDGDGRVDPEDTVLSEGAPDAD